MPPTLRRAAVAGLAALAIGAVAPAGLVAAHTETDFVAVPAGSTAVVTFAPEHGCGGSPTVDVRIQAPVEGATAVEEAGWTASATPDGAGRTVLQWTGGSLPADQAGSFQVELTVPDAVGALVAFPAVQTCADGAQETWIETEPEAESPAPQLLVLAPGSAPAATLDDVPADAPGRDLLTAVLTGEVVHDDAAATATTDPATTAAAPTTTAAATTTAPPATTAAPTTVPDATAAPTTTVADGGGGGGWVVALVVAVVVLAAVAGVVAYLRRRPAA